MELAKPIHKKSINTKITTKDKGDLYENYILEYLFGKVKAE